jgi:type IV secretory pathway VirB4 component
VLENLQSQRITLHLLSSEFDSTISMASSTRLKPTSEASQSQSSYLDAHPALLALMQHIGLADGKSNNLDGAIKQLVSELSQQADSNVLQILQLSQEAPKSSRAALQDISNALTTSSVRDSEVDDLERRIAAARTQLDGLTPHAP